MIHPSRLGCRHYRSILYETPPAQQDTGTIGQGNRTWRLPLTTEAQSTQRSAEILRATPRSLCLCGEKQAGINSAEPVSPVPMRWPWTIGVPPRSFAARLETAGSGMQHDYRCSNSNTGQFDGRSRCRTVDRQLGISLWESQKKDRWVAPTAPSPGLSVQFPLHRGS